MVACICVYTYALYRDCKSIGHLVFRTCFNFALLFFNVVKQKIIKVEVITATTLVTGSVVICHDTASPRKAATPNVGKRELQPPLHC